MMITNTNSLRLEQWGTSQLFGKSSSAGELRFALYHGGPDDERRLVQTWDVEALPEREAFRELLATIDDAARSDAANLRSGVQHYVLVAATPDGSPRGSLTLSYAPNSHAMGLGTCLDSEPPSQQGLVAMNMRQTNSAFQLLCAGHGAILETTNRLMAQMASQNGKMAENQNKIFELMAELSEKKLERDVLAEQKRKEAEIEFYREVERIERSTMWAKHGTQILALLLSYAPFVVSRIMGKHVGQSPVTTREEMLAELFGQFSAEQVEGLKQVFSGAQMANFDEIISQIFAARGASSEQRPHANAGPATSPTRPTSPPASATPPPPSASTPPGATTIPNFDEIVRKVAFPGFVTGGSGFPPPSSNASSSDTTVVGSLPLADVAPSTVSTTLDKLSTASVDVALAKIKEILLPFVIKQMKGGESIEPRAFLPRETRIFELLMRSISKAQYDELLTKESGFDDDEQSAIANLAKAMHLVPATPTSKTEENSIGGGSGLAPSNSMDGK